MFYHVFIAYSIYSFRYVYHIFISYMIFMVIYYTICYVLCSSTVFIYCIHVLLLSCTVFTYCYHVLCSCTNFIYCTYSYTFRIIDTLLLVPVDLSAHSNAMLLISYHIFSHVIFKSFVLCFMPA